ncbi:MAG: metallophosphoesterase [Acidimicrobiales bacterium]
MTGTATADTVPARPPPAARVLHTSDWHLGVAVRNHPRSDDHDALIAELVAVAAAAGPDLIVHTGDLFDGPRPPMVEFGRAIRALRSLAEVAPVVVLAGNHDSATALEVLGVAVGDEHPGDLAGGAAYEPHAPCRHRIRVHHKPVLPEQGAVATYPTAAGWDLRLAALPFVHHNRVLSDFAALCEPNATYNDSLRRIIKSIADVALGDFDPARQVAVFASHLHVTGASTSSEKAIHVSTDYATDPAHLAAGFGYLAFGHIHVPQPVAGGRGQYAGSILEVDFGETGEAKRVVLVDLEPGRPTRVTSVALTAGRRLHRVAAPLAALADHAEGVGTGIVEVTVTPPISTPTAHADDGAAADADSHAPSDPPLALTAAAVAAADRGSLAPTDGPAPLAGDAIVVGGVTFDTLSAAVRAVLPDATVVSVVDGRNPHVTVADEVDLDGAGDTVEAAFRRWLADAGDPIIAAKGDGAARVGRLVELFDELHAAVAAGEAPAPREVGELDTLTAVSPAVAAP